MAVKRLPRQAPAKADAGMGQREKEALCEVDCVNVNSVREARATVPNERVIVPLAETFKTLGDPTRLRIVAALANNELCVCDLAVVLGASQSAVSHSLRALRQLRLVKYRKEGKIAYYRLDDDHVSLLLREGLQHISELEGGAPSLTRV